jgi:hypothetical protein
MSAFSMRKEISLACKRPVMMPCERFKGVDGFLIVRLCVY